MRAEGELDILTAPALHAVLDAALDDPGDTLVVLDLSQVTFADVTFLRVVCEARRTAVCRAGWLRLVYTHPAIGQLLHVTRLRGEFPQYLSACDAVHDRRASTGSLLDRLAC
ncbi:hypothetical protein GCM10010329_77670 [Streptomyces spiroverticillatus]|uniref:STAS domain-containing protein n=1 Tax=Streptomyces finlayi TaxID=67296 RepID=A0A918X5B9_9ACTN|nr:STAS domain-containing protein [Streptomyces finlayi]GHA43301.1 hypothetical protein GCM10010329_77670 [Streptomyces spiroverticillatus]GHD13461.1 hypothetical protein GCM10010334_71680 [Streptomyces finlayi]